MTNINPEQLNLAKNQLETAKNILLAVPANSNTDKIAGALSLYLSLSAAGKQVSIISPSEMTVNYNQLIGVDKISSNFAAKSGRNLVISFPYQEGSIEKVSYNIENETFNLVIEPREGYPAIVPEMMKYSSSNGNFDVILTIGASNPAELKQIYTDNQSLFTEKPVINIDNNGGNSNFGKINLVDSTASSVSEVILGILDQIGLTIETDIASNLLAGLTDATGNFSSPRTSAATFENAASLLKYGAKKQAVRESKPEAIPQYQPQQAAPRNEQPTQQRNNVPFNRPPRIPFGRQTPTTPPVTSQNQPFLRPRPPQMQQQPERRPFTRPFQQQPRQQQQPAPTQQQQPPVQAQQQPSQTQETGRPPDAPPDWLKPKIYKGSTLL